MCALVTSQLSRPRQQVFRGQTGRKPGTEATSGGVHNFQEGIKNRTEQNMPSMLAIGDILASATSHSSVLVWFRLWFKNACVKKGFA